jgi:RNA polymerase sigma-70 factor (ECF subfamily)
MVALRMDRRIRARTDPSDVVQDALIAAHGKLPVYLREQPVLFYPWLRQIAWEQLIQHTRRHLGAAARTVLREEELEPGLSDASAALLSRRLADSFSAPESRAHKGEQRARIKAALALLSPEHREVLVLRFLEELSLAEVAAVLGIREPAVRGRQFRAIQRLQSSLADLDADLDKDDG